jgi:hypothetical protein
MEALADRVKETTSTTGTGSLSLSGAVSGFQTFNAAFSTTKFFYYVLLDVNGTDWETGEGYLSGASTLVRNRIYRSTNSNNALNLSATGSTVFCDAHAQFFDNLNGKIYAYTKALAMP